MTKNRPLFFSLAGCAAVCLILRVVLKLTAVDPATGFYEGGGALPLVFNILLGVSVLLLLAAGYLSGRRTRGASVTFTIPLRALAFAAGISLAVWAFLNVEGILEILPEVLTPDSRLLFKLFYCLFVVLFRLVLPIVFIYVLECIAGFVPNRKLWKDLPGKDEPDFAHPINPFDLREAHGYLRMNGWLMLLPLVWEIGELLSSFMAYTALRNVSDQMLTIVMLILMAPFLLAHARILSGVGAEKGVRQLLFFGPAFALFAIAVPGGMIAAALAGKTVALGLSPAAAVFYFLSGLYAAALCLSLRRSGR
ncbi:hypothetical protein [Anaerotruncus massiliensis (ex Togo et al. 2019)]|nr:hypothetical protein [Anaerotruncus massiliensis (ex Togo et al. 2019)]